MSEIKPSPGPWRINGPSSLRDDSVQIVDAEGDTVTHVVADDTQEIEDGSIAEVLSGRAKANAQLIAAAPTLLAELNAAAHALEMEAEHYRDDDRYQSHGKTLLQKAKKARAALKKAGTL